MPDAVNSPSHYKRDGVPFECIDVIKAALTPEEVLGFLRGNVLKYQYRARRKHATPEGFSEDVRKAKWYNDRLVEALAGKPVAKSDVRCRLRAGHVPAGHVPAGDFAGCPKAVISTVRSADGEDMLVPVCTVTNSPCANGDV